MLDCVTVDDFLPHLGQELPVDLPDVDDALAMRLVSATPARHAMAGQRLGFSLVLRAPVRMGIAQGVYPLHHPRLGRLEIFLVPIGADEHTVEYEAVFN